MLEINQEEYSNFIETKLDEADNQAENSNIRLSHEEVFESIRKEIHKG